MDGVGAQQPVEVFGTGRLRRQPAFGEEGPEPVGRVLGGEDPHHFAPRIGERRFDRVQAKQPDALRRLRGGRHALDYPARQVCRAYSAVVFAAASEAHVSLFGTKVEPWWEARKFAVTPLIYS